jgi:hypothetical protein
MVLLLAACGAAPAPKTMADAVKSPPAASAESADCKAERLAIMDAIEQSQAKPCAADAECATATNPGSFVKEFDVVVNAADREAIDARSRAHLDRCGAFHYYEPTNAIRVVEAACRDGRCAEEETVLHVDE